MCVCVCESVNKMLVNKESGNTVCGEHNCTLRQDSSEKKVRLRWDTEAGSQNLWIKLGSA